MKTAKMRWFAAIAATIALLCAGAATAPAASASPTSPPTLSGETLSTTSGPAGNPLMVSGTATGPYPGMFTETISYQTACGLCIMPSSLTSYTATFTIASGTTTVTGSEVLTSESVSFVLSFNGTFSFGGPTQYHATISTSGGDYLDVGTTQAGWGETNGVVSDGGDAFTSTQAQTTPVPQLGLSSTLAGETLSVANEPVSAPLTVSGTATGPYPGPFTETISFGTAGASTGSGYLNGYTATFTIISGTTTVTGSEYLASASASSALLLNGILGFGGPTAYQATISTSGGNYFDWGTTRTGWSESNGVISGSDVFASTVSPEVGGVSPASGLLAGGSSVTITGSGFTGATGVSFGSVAVPASAFTVTSDGSITATVPAAASAGPVDVTVTTPNGTSAASPADQYIYLAAPAVSGVSPASGPLAGGTSVTIAGSGFTGATAVSFGSVAVPASAFTVTSDGSITATIPAATVAGAVDVTVTTPNGTSQTGPADTYTYTAPAGTATAVLTDSVGNPIAAAAVTFRSPGGSAASATTGSDGTASVVLTPGSYSVTVYYATGYQTKTLSVTLNGPNVVNFATVAVIAQISDPSAADLAAASVAHAGNTGSFGPKTAVNAASGQVVFQVLPGTNTFTAWDAGGYQSQTITATGPATVTFATAPVTVQIIDPSGTDLAAASVAHAGNTGSFGPKMAVDGNGLVTFQVLPGTSTFTAWDAGGYQSQTVTVTGSGQAPVTFATVAVTVTVTKNGSPLGTAMVTHAGNTGSFGPKTAVDPGSGQVAFQVLPGTSYFTAFDGTAYTKQTLTVTTAASTTIPVA